MVASIFDIVPMSSYHLSKSHFKRISLLSKRNEIPSFIYSEIQLFPLPKKDL